MPQCQIIIISIKALLLPLQIVITFLLWDLPESVLLGTSLHTPSFSSSSGFFLACCSLHGCSCRQEAFYSQPAYPSQSLHVRLLLCLPLPIAEIALCHCPLAVCTRPEVLVFILHNRGDTVHTSLRLHSHHSYYSLFFHPPRKDKASWYLQT